MEQSKLAQINTDKAKTGVVYITDNENMFIAPEGLSEAEYERLSLETDNNAMQKRLAELTSETQPQTQNLEHTEEIERKPLPNLPDNFIENQKKTMPHTKTWKYDFPNVFSSRLYTDIKRNAEIESLRLAAKAGDSVKALDFVKNTVDLSVISKLKQTYPDAIVCPVLAEEASGNNQIPAAYLSLFKAFGFETSTDIVQSVRAHHTGANSLKRMLNRVRFDGEVKEGRNYILIDDHTDYGGTLRDFKDFIESKGGNVVAFSTLTSLNKETRILPDKENLSKLNRYGGKLDELLKQFGITDNKEGLTDGEVTGLLRLLSDTSTNRKFENRSQEDFSNRLRLLGQELKESLKLQEKLKPVVNRFNNLTKDIPEEILSSSQRKLITDSIYSQNHELIKFLNSYKPHEQNDFAASIISLVNNSESHVQSPFQEVKNTVLPEFAILTSNGIESFKDLKVENFNEAENSYTLSNGNSTITVTGDTFKEIIRPERFENQFEKDTPAYEKLLESQYNDFFKQRENTANNFHHNMSVYCRKEANSPIDALTISKEIISRMDKTEKEKTRLLLNQIKREDETINQLLVRTYYEAIKEVPLDREKILNQNNEKLIAKPFHDTLSAKGQPVDENSKLKIGDTIKDMSFNIPKAFGHGKDRIFEDLTVISASKEGNNVILMDKNRSFYEVPRDTLLEGYNKLAREKQQKAEQKHRMANRIDVGWER